MKPECDRPLMLFDLSIRGHHPAYIQHLIRYAYQRQVSDQIVVVVSPRFLEEHSDVVAFAATHTPQIVQFIPIQAEEEADLGKRKTAWDRSQRRTKEWKILVKYATELNAHHCVALYLDTCLSPLGLSTPAPCPVSGIYFRPTFHYHQFAHYQPRFKDRIQHWREQLTLALAGRRPQLHTVFSLDPFAVEPLKRLLQHGTAIHLPDPVEIGKANLERVPELRADLGVEADRQVFLLFGALTDRKGVRQLLQAIAHLPQEDAQKLCLVLIGESNLIHELETLIALLTNQLPVQILRHYEFVPEADVSAYFQLADVVLAPYQRHVGMSGILLQAAAAGKPVLSSDYGLMGELVHRYKLGLTVDSTQPKAIASGLHYCLNHPLETLGDRDQMQHFAEQNSAERFAEVIFNQLLPSSVPSLAQAR